MLIEFRALNDGNMEWGSLEKPDRHGSLMISVYRYDRYGTPKNLPNPLVARAWGDVGKVPHPYKGALYRKTVMLPNGTTGPLLVTLYWLASDWGKIDFNRLDIMGLTATSGPFHPRRRVRLKGLFDVSHALPGA